MFSEKTFDAGKVGLNYMDYGSPQGKPVVILHGGAWCWQEFLSLIPELSEGRHIYALDLRGNGRSGWVSGQYRLNDFTCDTERFVKHLDRPCVLIGHSIGGVVALMTEERLPESVSALIIEDSPLTLDNYKTVIDSSRDMFRLWLELKKSARSSGELKVMLAESYRNLPGVTDDWVRFFAGCLWQLDPTFFDALLFDFDGFTAGYDYKRILSKLRCSILFIRGEKDLGAVMTDDEVAWVTANCPNATCRSITGVGHLLHLQDAGLQPVLKEMKTFLEG